LIGFSERLPVNGPPTGHSWHRIYSEGYMTGKYRIEIELLLDESTATQALALARDSHPFSRSLERSWKLIPSRPPLCLPEGTVGLIVKEPFGRIAT